MNFEEIFASFKDHEKDMKVINVASCDKEGKPNSAAKMLMDVVEPNEIYFLDYRYTQTYSNVKENPQLSVSFMNDASFTGFRLTGPAEALDSGPQFEKVKKNWDRLLISYEADRILQRVMGRYSTKESESMLPRDFIIVKVVAKEAAVIKPDRVFRATH